jgi:hypothetical protein
MGDDDYVKFKEEEVNTKKMSTILKSLNSPRRRTASNFHKQGTHQRLLSKTDRSFGRNMGGTAYSQNVSSGNRQIE